MSIQQKSLAKGLEDMVSVLAPAGNSLQQRAHNPSSQCCKRVLCLRRKDSPLHDRRTLKGVPQPVSSLQHGLPYALHPCSVSLCAGQCAAAEDLLGLELPKRVAEQEDIRA